MNRKVSALNLPTFDKLILPIIKALVELGGSGSIKEINAKVYEIHNISEKVLNIPHGESGTLNEVDYRLAWSRTYLKKFGLLENSSRGVWALANPNLDISALDSAEIVRAVREKEKEKVIKNEKNDKSRLETIEKIDKSKAEINEEITDEVDSSEEWKERLLNVLYDISPAAFERLAQRILRESGFSQVEVTGKVGDGGIDGKGIVRVSGLLSFHVIFQCKRYKGSISPSQIRDFRGAMQGRADKGLFITTGKFTREALKESTRDGAPPLDLIDGEILCEKLKELNLGLETKLIEQVEIKHEWFEKL